MKAILWFTVGCVVVSAAVLCAFSAAVLCAAGWFIVNGGSF